MTSTRPELLEPPVEMHYFESLRQHTEKKADALANLQILQTQSPENTKLILNELIVHQIEVVMQNEELREKQEKLIAARLRYFELYDLAPVGYLTVNKNGLILEANLAASTMLDVPRSLLLQNLLLGFVSPEDNKSVSVRGVSGYEFLTGFL